MGLVAHAHPSVCLIRGHSEETEDVSAQTQASMVFCVLVTQLRQTSSTLCWGTHCPGLFWPLLAPGSLALGIESDGAYHMA